MVMRRLDSVTATIALTVVVAMVLGFSLQQAVTIALPYFAIASKRPLPRHDRLSWPIVIGSRTRKQGLPVDAWRTVPGSRPPLRTGSGSSS
jgi:hypothetical protein